MKLSRYIFLLAVCLWNSIPLPLMGGDAGVVKVAADTTWPPMEMKDKNGSITGYGIDMMNAIALESGFQVEFKSVSWDDIFKGLDEGRHDAVMSSVAITPERKAKYDFSKPYFTAGQILVVPVELKDADMSGKTVGLLEGTSVPNAVFKKKGMRIRSYSDIERAFADMKKKTIDGVVCDFPVAGNYSVLKDEYKGMFILSGEPFTREDYGIVVKKGNKGLLEKINAGLDGVRKKGLDKRLEEKWLMGK